MKDIGEPVIYDVELKNDSKNLINISYGRKINNKLALGIGGKIIYEKIGEYSNYGFGADLSAIYNLNRRTRLGARLADITGTHLRWSTGSWETRLPSVTVGICRRIQPRPRWIELYTLAELYTRFDNLQEGMLFHTGAISYEMKFGTEVWLKNLLAMRAGYDGDRVNLGAGLKIAFLQFDYAYTGYELGTTHKVSVNITIPEIKLPHRKPREKMTTEEHPPISVEVPSEPVVTATVGKEETLAVYKVQKVEKITPITPGRETHTIAPSLDGKMVTPCFFELGRVEIKPEFRDTLRKIAEFLKSNPEYDILITGHTDDIPVHIKYPDNYALSYARADAVANIFIKEFGIADRRIKLKGMGADKPIDNINKTRNRRVEIIFLKVR